MSRKGVARPDLAEVYRRFTRGRSQALPEANALLGLAEGERSPASERLLAEVARSGVHADLLRFARALAPESARLGMELEQALEASAPLHRSASRQASRRAGARRAPVRIAAGVAACLIAGFAVWFVQHRHAPAPAVAQAPASGDRIFAALDSRPAGDVIFRGEFSRDQIFNGRFNGG